VVSQISHRLNAIDVELYAFDGLPRTRPAVSTLVTISHENLENDVRIINYCTD
jgi:hypothetical protein